MVITTFSSLASLLTKLAAKFTKHWYTRISLQQNPKNWMGFPWVPWIAKRVMIEDLSCQLSQKRVLKFPQNLVLNMTKMKLPPSTLNFFRQNNMDNGCNPANLLRIVDLPTWMIFLWNPKKIGVCTAGMLLHRCPFFLPLVPSLWRLHRSSQAPTGPMLGTSGEIYRQLDGLRPEMEYFFARKMDFWVEKKKTPTHTHTLFLRVDKIQLTKYIMSKATYFRTSWLKKCTPPTLFLGGTCLFIVSSGPFLIRLHIFWSFLWFQQHPWDDWKKLPTNLP